MFKDKNFKKIPPYQIPCISFNYFSYDPHLMLNQVCILPYLQLSKMFPLWTAEVSGHCLLQVSVSHADCTLDVTV